MKFQIKHECRGRIRVQAVQQRMTLEQADMLEAWLLTLPQVECASVHERTRCAVIEYQGDRKDLLRILAGFSYQDHALAELVPVHSSRALNRAYEEKLVGMVAFKAVRSLFFPAPLRAVYTVIRSAPYLFRALRCLLRRQLHVELLDGISVCLSMVRRDFDTASSVMFLLRLGELLEEWTHKKSVENLARSMSLNIDRVWMKTESGEEQPQPFALFAYGGFPRQDIENNHVAGFVHKALQRKDAVTADKIISVHIRHLAL